MTTTNTPTPGEAPRALTAETVARAVATGEPVDLTITTIEPGEAARAVLAEALRAELLASGAMPEELQHVMDAGEPMWDTAALQADYTVLGFQAPFVVVRRKSDGVTGSLCFTHQPRVYFNFMEDV